MGIWDRREAGRRKDMRRVQEGPAEPIHYQVLGVEGVQIGGWRSVKGAACHSMAVGCLRCTDTTAAQTLGLSLGWCTTCSTSTPWHANPVGHILTLRH